MDSTFDVVIVGAGPAGLLLGSLLAQSARVLILEKGVIGRTQKYWVTTRRRLARHSLLDCISFEGRRLLVGTFLGSEALGIGDIAVVNDELLLETLIDRCKGVQVEFRERSELLSVRRNAEFILASTTSGDYNARLLVDATGGLSPIASTFRLHRLDGFFTVYGAHIQGLSLKSADIVVAYVLRLGYPPPMFEVIPTGPDAALCALFLADRRLVPVDEVRRGFESHLKKNPFFEMSVNSKTVAGKMGGIPIGCLRRKSMAGIASFGEAALIQPPLLGTAFNEILEHAELVAEEMVAALTAGKKIDKNIGMRFPRAKRLNDWLQRVMIRTLLKGDVSTVNKMVAALGRLDPELVFRLYSNEIRWSDMRHFVPHGAALMGSNK